MYELWLTDINIMDSKISGIILAAGLSTRMGEPKQLLPFGNSTIIETVIDNMLGAKLENVIVVIGHEAEKIRTLIEHKPRRQHKPIVTVFNPDYRQGMLTSAQCGVASLPESADAFALTLVDAPFITSELVDLVIDAYNQTERGIAVPSYNYRRGHPVVFDRRYADTILALDEESGGVRSLFKRYADDIHYVVVDTDHVLRDIDYREDYEEALREIGKSVKAT
jgi:molybdenum cofactor cytidylyltransferase